MGVAVVVVVSDEDAANKTSIVDNMGFWKDGANWMVQFPMLTMNHHYAECVGNLYHYTHKNNNNNNNNSQYHITYLHS
jgi:hypothetical protein